MPKALDKDADLCHTEGMNKSTTPQTAAEKRAIMANYYNVAAVLITDETDQTEEDFDNFLRNGEGREGA